MHLSLVEECRVRVEQALAALAASSNLNERLEMRLCAAQGARCEPQKRSGGAGENERFEPGLPGSGHQ